MQNLNVAAVYRAGAIGDARLAASAKQQAEQKPLEATEESAKESLSEWSKMAGSDLGGAAGNGRIQ